LAELNDLDLLACDVQTIDGITAVFKLKNGEAEQPDMYIGAQIEEMLTQDGRKCWIKIKFWNKVSCVQEIFE